MVPHIGASVPLFKIPFSVNRFFEVFFKYILPIWITIFEIGYGYMCVLQYTSLSTHRCSS